MEKDGARYTLSSLAALLGGVADGQPNTILDGPVSAGDDDPLGVCFAESEKYLECAEGSGVGAIIVSKSCRASTKPLIRVEHPRLAFGHLLALSKRSMQVDTGIHPGAIVDAEAKVDPSAAVGAYVVIQSGAEIGARAKLFPFSFVGENSKVGEECVLYPHAVLYRDVVLGKRVVVHGGAVIGADGFGYVWDGKARLKVPQVGSVEVGDDVEIGANTTIDRATAGVTRIGKGTKLDNLVQVAHNVSIGSDGVIAAQTGISGSATIGDRVVIAGDVGIVDHVNITDDVTLGGRSAVDRDIDEPGGYLGVPARPVAEAKRAMLIAANLPELLSRVRTLEEKVRGLEGEQK